MIQKRAPGASLFTYQKWILNQVCKYNRIPKAERMPGWEDQDEVIFR